MPLQREILKFGLKHLARQDAEQAKRLWDGLRAAYHFDAGDIVAIERDIALAAAYQSCPEALAWLSAASLADDPRGRAYRAVH